jgi:hypothetical protein
MTERDLKLRTFDTHSISFPGAHRASCAMGSGSLFQGDGLKRSRRGVDHPLPSNAEVKERVKLYLCYLSGPSWPFLG